MGSPHDYLERCDSLAVMGGTFDPIHMGHLTVAQSVLEEFKPRRVLFVPGGRPPHKPDKPVTDGGHRYRMTLAAICDNPGFDVSAMEVNREGHSYTVDTISRLREICPAGADIYFIIGADALMEILTWKDAPELLTMCKFIAVPRPGYDLDTDYVENLRTNYNACVYILDIPRLDISGTDIRERFESGRFTKGLMPPGAEDYARLHGLYQTGRSVLTDQRFEEITECLRLRLSQRRFNHTLGMVEESEKLARHYGANLTKARWAALLHDCTKEYSVDKKRALCALWGIPLDDILSAHIDLTHSLLGAESARRDYMVNDPEILQAIRYHTTGHKKLTLLDKIIILADYIEPTRENYPPLADMRRLAYIDINKALIIGMKFTNGELKARGNAIHPWCKDAMRTLRRERRELQITSTK